MTIHFLNVNEGDCSIIEHSSRRVTVIDVCNASPPDDPMEQMMREVSESGRGILGDFQQKKHPVNPIEYMETHHIQSVFRYVQTHPDMDHMDGIEAFFGAFKPTNFWDTDNKEKKDDFGSGGRYKRSDWLFYKRLRDGKPSSSPTRLVLDPSSRGKYYSQPDGGDRLSVLAPTKKLICSANRTGNYNDASYVILYTAPKGHRIVFAGDSHDRTWDYILDQHADDVRNIDLLIAPHHGRDSQRSYDFLKILNPTLTFFGNARHEHLAYDAWNNRGLQKITNNQANCMVVDDSADPMDLYVTHMNYAKKINPKAPYSQEFQAYYVGAITEDLLP